MEDILSKELCKKEKKLWEQLMDYTKEDICIAFSGGVDSSLLVTMADLAAKENGHRIFAVTADTVLHPKADFDHAIEVIKNTHCKHHILKIDELTVPEIRNNPKNRCYLCKKEIYSQMLTFAKAQNCKWLLEGTNEDDLHVYRPGLLAVRELGVKSPLADCGITKKEVRYLAEKYQVSTAHRPSSPCLATRLPYGTEIDLSVLQKIDKIEEFLRKMGYQNVRARVHGDLVRLEMDKDRLPEVLEEKERIISNIKKQGFRYVTLDLEGFRSGSMD